MKKLSIILPVYNEERRLPGAIQKILLYQNTFRRPVEIIAVTNACTDGSVELCEEYAFQNRNFYHYDLIHRGKGTAVAVGMLAASGDWCYMADVDFATPVETVEAYIERAEKTGADLVLGTRPQRSGYRSFVGWVFHQVVAGLVPGIQDTQCGFKLFRGGAVVGNLFGASRINGMAFDVEILYLAQRMGYTIHQFPVAWRNDSDSRVRLVGDTLDMLADVIRIPKLHAYKKLPA